MSDLTPWLLAGGAVLILAAGWVAAWLLTQHEMLLPWDDTAVIPVWVDGWGADGWCPLAELCRLERDAAVLDDDGWRAWLDGHWARAVTADLHATPLLAGLVAHVPAIETTRPLELTGV